MCIEHDNINKHFIYVTMSQNGIGRLLDFVLLGQNVKSGHMRLLSAILMKQNIKFIWSDLVMCDYFLCMQENPGFSVLHTPTW